MITIAIAALAAMVPGSTYDPIPEPAVALENPCAVVSALGDEDYYRTCVGAETVVAALGGYTIEQGGFRFRLLDGTTVGNGQTMAYVAELRVDTTSALTRVQYACVDTVTNEIVRADGEPVLIRTVHEVEEGWVTLATAGPCPLGSERTILTVATWSNSDEPWMDAVPDPNAGTDGWVDGDNVAQDSAGTNVWRVRYDVISTPVYGETGMVEVTATCEYADLSNDRNMRIQLEFLNAAAQTYIAPINCKSSNVGQSHTFEIDTGTRQFSQMRAGIYVTLDYVVYQPVGHEDRWEHVPEAGAWYVVGTISKWDKTSGIEWHPTIQDPTVGDVAGLCEDGDIQECVTRCVDLLTPGWNPLDNVGDFGQFMLCLIVPQTNVGDVVGAAQEDLSQTRAWQISGTVMDTVRESAMLPVRYATGCGRVLNLDFGDTFGPMSLDVSTCSVPEHFRKIVYVGTTVLGSLAILGGILYTIFWAFGWKSPVRLGDSESED